MARQIRLLFTKENSPEKKMRTDKIEDSPPD